MSPRNPVPSPVSLAQALAEQCLYRALELSLTFKLGNRSTAVLTAPRTIASAEIDGGFAFFEAACGSC